MFACLSVSVCVCVRASVRERKEHAIEESVSEGVQER